MVITTMMVSSVVKIDRVSGRLAGNSAGVVMEILFMVDPIGGLLFRKVVCRAGFSRKAAASIPPKGGTTNNHFKNSQPRCVSKVDPSLTRQVMICVLSGRPTLLRLDRAFPALQQFASTKKFLSRT